MTIPGNDGEQFDTDFLSFNNYRFTLFGHPMATLKELSWKASQETGLVYGSAEDPLGGTTGKRSYELSFTVRTDEWDRTGEKVQASTGKPILSQRGDALLNYGMRGQPPHTREFRIHRLSTEEGSIADGVDATEIKVTGVIIVIKKDGKPLFEDSIYED